MILGSRVSELSNQKVNRNGDGLNWDQELMLSASEKQQNGQRHIEPKTRLGWASPTISATARHNVLVFPCGSEIGLEIHRSVATSNHFELFGASSVHSNHGRFVYRNYIDGLPSIDNIDAISAINDVVSRFSIDMIFPAHDSVVVALANQQDNLQSPVVGSPAATCSVCRSKGRTYEVFRDILAVPKRFDLSNLSDSTKVFLKPDVGQGSKGTYIAESRREVEFYLAKDPTLLILEFLPGREYTVDCFTDRHGVLRFVGPRERVRVSNGISVNTRPVTDTRCISMANVINATLKFRGAWFFQVKEDVNGTLTLLEVAPRVAGAMGLHRSMGVNLGLLSLFDMIGREVEILPNRVALEMDQALRARYNFELHCDEVFIDLDDTLICKEQVNPLVVAFVFQCINRGIRTTLITRHNGNLEERLIRYRLDRLFDKVIHLTNGENKAEHIRSQKAILIDDSFAERKRVHEATGIPVFDLDVVESLLDSRI